MACGPSAEARRAELARLYEGYRKGFPQVGDISARELHEALSQPGAERGLVLVDVRSAPEQAVSRLPGPVLTREAFEAQRDRLRGRRVVTYCTAGKRSGDYAERLRRDGFPDVRNLAGSILAWTQEGYPLVTKGDPLQPTRRVHVFGPQWELQGDGYEAVMFPAPQGVLEGVRSVMPRWLGGRA